MWQDTGAVFRLRLTDDGQFESVEGMGTGQLGGRWNTWDAERCVRAPSYVVFGDGHSR